MECINNKEFYNLCLLLVSVAKLLRKKDRSNGSCNGENKEPLVGANVTVKDQAGLGAIPRY